MLKLLFHFHFFNLAIFHSLFIITILPITGVWWWFTHLPYNKKVTGSVPSKEDLSLMCTCVSSVGAPGSHTWTLKPSLWPWTQLKISGSSVWQIEASSSRAGQWFIRHPSLRGRRFLPVLCRGGADQFPVRLHRQRHRAESSSSWPATCTARWASLRTLRVNFNGGWVIVVFQRRHGDKRNSHALSIKMLKIKQKTDEKLDMSKIAWVCMNMQYEIEPQVGDRPSPFWNSFPP